MLCAFARSRLFPNRRPHGSTSASRGRKTSQSFQQSSHTGLTLKKLAHKPGLLPAITWIDFLPHQHGQRWKTSCGNGVDYATTEAGLCKPVQPPYRHVHAPGRADTPVRGLLRDDIEFATPPSRHRHFRVQAHGMAQVCGGLCLQPADQNLHPAPELSKLPSRPRRDTELRCPPSEELSSAPAASAHQ